MVGIYLDDGHPESEEYEGNYIYYNDRDPGDIQDVMTQLRGRGREDVAEWIGALYAPQLNRGPERRRSTWQRFAEIMFGSGMRTQRLYHH